MTRVSIGLLACVAVASACGEDERDPLGGPGPTGEYCIKSGHEVVGSDCNFADGTSCEAWAFYRATCGQSHSYCVTHGGAIASVTVDMGTWTAIVAICTLPGGQQCAEAEFAKTGKCE